MTLYMAVTPDEYELPLIVTPRVQELAEAYGTTMNTIRSSICHETSGRNRGAKFVKVVLDEEDQKND